MPRSPRRTVLALAAGGVLLASGTSAFAYWTTIGGGTGTATAITASPLTSGTAQVTGTLYPGAQVTGSLQVRNTNPFPVKVTSAVLQTAQTTATACTTTGVTFTVTTVASPTQPLTVPAATSATSPGTATLDYRAQMDNTSSSGCQGASFTSTLQLQGQS